MACSLVLREDCAHWCRGWTGPGQGCQTKVAGDGALGPSCYAKQLQADLLCPGSPLVQPSGTQFEGRAQNMCGLQVCALHCWNLNPLKLLSNLLEALANADRVCHLDELLAADGCTFSIPQGLQWLSVLMRHQLSNYWRAWRICDQKLYSILSDAHQHMKKVDGRNNRAYKPGQ